MNGQAVVVGVRIERVGLVLDLIPIAEPVSIGVRRGRVGPPIELGGIAEAILIGVSLPEHAKVAGGVERLPLIRQGIAVGVGGLRQVVDVGIELQPLLEVDDA